MRALLVLFMVAAPEAGGFGFDLPTAYAIYGLYTASVYGWSLPGGWIADRFLGQRRAVLSGGVLIAIGYLLLAIPSPPVFFSALVLVVFGTGLLKPNISTIVGQLYQQGDPRRDSGFSIFYMGINIGAFAAPLACGYVGQRINWHYGFALAGIGMTLGIVTYLIGWKRLGEAGLHPVTPASPEQAAGDRKLLRWGGLVLGLALAGLGTLAFSGAVTPQGLNNGTGVFLLLVTVGLFGYLYTSAGWTPAERRRLTVILVFFIASALFWSAFEQAGSSLNVFAQRHTRTSVFGWEFPASWLQSANAYYLVLFAPVFAWLWGRLGPDRPPGPMKLAWGLVCGGAGFLFMMAGAQASAGGQRVSLFFLAATYFCHTVGELCLSPVGLSAMTKLAPQRAVGFMMGVWFLSLSVGNYLGGKIAAFYGGLPMADLFRTVAIFTVGAGLVLALIARRVARLERAE
jgi:POT family proton-dependent oligopeptide transporter